MIWCHKLEFVTFEISVVSVLKTPGGPKFDWLGAGLPKPHMGSYDVDMCLAATGWRVHESESTR